MGVNNETIIIETSSDSIVCADCGKQLDFHYVHPTEHANGILEVIPCNCMLKYKKIVNQIDTTQKGV